MKSEHVFISGGTPVLLHFRENFLLSTFTPRTSESIDMSILNALGLGKCLDTSLDRQLRQKAKKLLKAH